MDLEPDSALQGLLYRCLHPGLCTTLIRSQMACALAIQLQPVYSSQIEWNAPVQFIETLGYGTIFVLFRIYL